ncbi:MAG: SDR family NAD(P)-dependent oxidoreductase, partial [Gemmobacter sp.]
MKPVALVTGGQQGIGLGIAEALGRAGFALALAAELPPEDARVGAALATLGPDARYVRHDLRETGAEEALLARV